MAVRINLNDETDQQNAQGGSQPQPLQTIGTATPAGQAPTGQAPMRPQPQGSGRFTNLQKYIQANKGAGQRIAGQVGQTVQKDVSQQQQKAQQYYNQLGQNIQQSRQAAEQGAGFQQQLQNIGTGIESQIYKPTYDEAAFTQQYAAPETTQVLTPEEVEKQRQDAYTKWKQQQDVQALQKWQGQQDAPSDVEQFVSDEDKFRRFQDIQAGRGINEQLLQLQQQKAQQQAQTVQRTAQQAQEQLGTEAGRFELLRKAFGGATRPGYTQGQQRLDQILLGQTGGLRQTQADVAQQLRTAQEQARLAGGQAGEVSRLTAQERGLMEQIGQQSQSNEAAYRQMLESYIDPLNVQRQQEFEQLGQSLSTYIPTYNEETGKYIQQGWQPGLTEQQMGKLGLSDANQGVYNVFKDEAFQQAMKMGTPEERNAMLAKVISEQGAQAQSAQDVARQQDVTRYQALAKILGMTPEEQQITAPSQLGEAWTAKTGEGEGGLRERLSEAERLFREAATTTKPKTGDFYGGQGRAASMQDVIEKGLYGYETRDDTAPNWTSIMDVIEGRGPTGPGTMDRKTAINLYNTWLNPYNAAKDYTPYEMTAQDERFFGRDLGNPDLTDQFRKFIEEQNYGQTLGGKRETYLDTLAKQRMSALGIAPKLEVTPITQEDPMLAYRQQFEGTKKLLGS